MAVSLQQLFVASLAVILCISYVSTQVLTPPYFNLAVGRRITATSTCGVGVSEAELFCKLTGANLLQNENDDLQHHVIRYEVWYSCNCRWDFIL